MKLSSLFFVLATIFWERLWSRTAQATPARSASPMPAGGGVQQRGRQAGQVQGDRFPHRLVRSAVRLHGAEQDRSDTGPDAAELARAIETATRMGLAVVLKPHLDPLIYSPGFDAFQSENDSWRVSCPGVASSTWTDERRLQERRRVRLAGRGEEGDRQPGRHAAAPVRLELGTELMNSMVYAPSVG